MFGKHLGDYLEDNQCEKLFHFFFFGGVDVSMEFTMEFILILSERFFLRTSSRGYSSSSVIRKGMDPLKFDIMRG